LAKFKIPTERINQRANFYVERFSDYCKLPDVSIYNTGEIDFNNAQIVSETYFLISEFYKLKHSIPIEHNTEYSKIAAITAIAISHRKLLSRKNTATSDENYAILNPEFGLRIGCERLKININKLTFEERDRLVQAIIDPELHCLDNYFWKLKNGKHSIGSEIEFSINPKEMAFIEGMISNFHFMNIAYSGPQISNRIND
jgi:hypothetical protein